MFRTGIRTYLHWLSNVVYMTFGASIPLINFSITKILILIKTFSLIEISQIIDLININLVII